MDQRDAEGRAWLSEPAVERRVLNISTEIRLQVGERTARRSVPTQGRSKYSGLRFPVERRRTASGLRSRQSGVGYGLSGAGAGTGTGPEPGPGAEYLNLGPEDRDPGPENGLTTADAMSSHPYLRQLGDFTA